MKYSQRRRSRASSNILPVVAWVVGVTVVVSLLVMAAVMYVKSRNAQQDDFRRDLVTTGFVITDGPDWEDEPAGKSKTDSALEATVTIAGCKVELERKDGEDDVIRTVDGRQIETYKFDEVNWDNQEIEPKEFDILSPNAAQIEEHLANNANRFPCYDASAH